MHTPTASTPMNVDSTHQVVASHQQPVAGNVPRMDRAGSSESNTVSSGGRSSSIASRKFTSRPGIIAEPKRSLLVDTLGESSPARPPIPLNHTASTAPPPRPPLPKKSGCPSDYSMLLSNPEPIFRRSHSGLQSHPPLPPLPVLAKMHLHPYLAFRAPAACHTKPAAAGEGGRDGKADRTKRRLQLELRRLGGDDVPSIKKEPPRDRVKKEGKREAKWRIGEANRPRLIQTSTPPHIVPLASPSILTPTSPFGPFDLSPPPLAFSSPTQWPAVTRSKRTSIKRKPPVRQRLRREDGWQDVYEGSHAAEKGWLAHACGEDESSLKVRRGVRWTELSLFVRVQSSANEVTLVHIPPCNQSFE
ncbi:unnamed protein product [Vitrella brassicaformis CCMP3155]|uniref:Uncharacterized protein n=1 Tax=Vitrella brassicaformis (strain CCMP3155) TaxID=1169540 RepID=A0A0G4G4I7_VITBC|nr:unnamed protein product [Vitrella brassicaformis CCMP3155]|eukprot:CEM23310.1 unnamed protein product [Vitrella brassicaformis CCMP3155]